MKIAPLIAMSVSLIVAGMLSACNESRIPPSEPGGQAAETDDRIVRTNSGELRGIELEGGVEAWLGIPYAQAPTQELRWRAPQPGAWDGIYNADRRMPECMQILRPHDINHYFGEEAISEDCLYMNIWAPAGADTSSGLPVVVFIYGGGGTVGSSGMALYDGAQVARHGAVFVNFNYRVGLLGFMAHPQLTAEQGGHSGNYGYLDQTLALRWVHDNIAQFGGDPDKVLISGQSFGAGSVTQQIFSPLAKGLFSSALMSSGCGWSGSLGSLEDGEQVGIGVAEALGVSGIEALRNVPADRFIDIQQEFQLGVSTVGLRAGGVIDGYFMPAAPAEILEAGGNADVPIVAHFNAQEGFGAVLTRATTVAEYEDLARQMWGPAADEFLAMFPVATDSDVWAQAHLASTTQGFEARARNCARLQSRFNESPLFISTFARRHSYAPGAEIADQDIATVGAYHTADIPFWFGTLEKFNMFRTTRSWTADDRALSELMMQAMISLAETGNPSTGLLDWPAWTPDSETKAVFGDEVVIVPLNLRAHEFFANHEAMEVESRPAPPLPGPRD